MSHELRTPLNSQLILSKLLSENEDGHLSEKEVEYAQTIHASGTELLSLINEILDLSKIESGTMPIDISHLSFSDVRNWARKSFAPVAEKKQLKYAVTLDTGLPSAIRTDGNRLRQVLKNLLSNAFKFTEKGGVTLDIRVAGSGWRTDHSGLNSARQVIAFSVTDTGIGIPTDKQKIVFEAFQQADGTTSRKYGGTGLGLSITREIIRHLGGDILVESAPDKGSKFTAYLPVRYEIDTDPCPFAGPKNNGRGVPAIPDTRPGTGPQPDSSPSAEDDDRNRISPGDRLVLIVEDDPVFARLLLDKAREKGFKGIVATRGSEAVSLARSCKPDAITLDLELPDMIGITVLDMLKRHMDTRHIPVHVISVMEKTSMIFQMGAVSQLRKPISKEQLQQTFDDLETALKKKMKKLLVIEDDETQFNSIRDLIGNGDVEVVGARSGKTALKRLAADSFDCIVLDLGLPDMSGFRLAEKINQNPDTRKIPIIVYTGRELNEQEETRLRKLSKSIIIKDVHALDRLLDETTLFLHRVVEKLPENKKKMLRELQQKDPVLADKKVLIVDDDVRNIFALTAILEQQKMAVLYAENGKDGIRILKENPDTAIVLMDIMMPDMDGYETMAHIRGMDVFRTLPVIALTAKAMKGDREKCMAAGASDYIAKPVEKEQLLSLMRVWLYQ